MNRRQLLTSGISMIALSRMAKALGNSPFFRGDDSAGSVLAVLGVFESPIVAPDWFRDAKFGIWAHWSPQCVPEQGDWYARNMYIQGTRQYEYHVKQYGHPSQFGYKDICHLWKAERWDPDALVKLYKRAGAEYLVSLATHHDNFDCWNSKYQPWNCVNIGPKRDIVGTWAKAARANGLRFGVSYHGTPHRTWDEFLPVRYKSDTTGSLAGVPYDGVQTMADGKGKWWQGLDPQLLNGKPHLKGYPLPGVRPAVHASRSGCDRSIRSGYPDFRRRRKVQFRCGRPRGSGLECVAGNPGPGAADHGLLLQQEHPRRIPVIWKASST